MDILGIGLGPTQILVILIVAFFVLGPDRLPEVARQLAKGIRLLRSYASDVQTQFGGELEDLREEFGGIQRDLTVIQGNIRSGLLEIDSSLKSVQDDVHSAVSEAAAAVATASGGVNGARPSLDYTPAVPTPPQPPALAGLAEPETPIVEPAEGQRLPDYRPPA